MITQFDSALVSISSSNLYAVTGGRRVDAGDVYANTVTADAKELLRHSAKRWNAVFTLHPGRVVHESLAEIGSGVKLLTDGVKPVTDVVRSILGK